MLPFYLNYRVNFIFGIFEIKLKRVLLENENMILGSKNKNVTLGNNELEIYIFKKEYFDLGKLTESYF